MRLSPAQTPADQRLFKNMELSTLCAFYGGLLTQRQRTALQLHYNEDFTLAEVAEHLGVSRQNVHDLISRSAQKLYRYEKALGSIAQSRQTTAILRQVLRALHDAQEIAGEDPAMLAHQITEINAMIAQAIIQLEGEE